MTVSPHVAVVIVNYKGRDDTLECLASLDHVTYPHYSVIVVDQASNDGTPAAIRAAFPATLLLENAINDGFAGGSNRGIRQAMDAGADYVFLLNNDTTVAPDLLDRLVAWMETWPDVGISGPLMLYYSDPKVIWSAGGYISPHGGSAMNFQGNEPTPHDAEELGYTNASFIVGCGLMVRRAVLEQIGLLDEQFFLYYEEADFCARARRAGWKIHTVWAARLWHKVSRSTGTDSELTLYYMRRNQLLFLERNSRRPTLARLTATADSLRLAVVWTVRGERRRAKVLLRAVGDYWLGRRGKTAFLFR